VSGVLASGGNAVMTSLAGARYYPRVIKDRRNPRISRVTVIASVSARNMGGVLARRKGAVVAGRTRTEYL